MGLRSLTGRLIVPLLFLLVTRAVLILSLPFASEDAYITLRYAHHLAQGLGLTYNRGEHVMGFTSLPWTIWCALGFLLHCSPVLWTQLTSAGADLLTILLGADLLARRHSMAAAWTFALFYSAWPLFAASAVSGLECNVFVLLILASARSIERRSPWAGPVLGLLAVFRPEGFVAALVLGTAADGRARIIAGAIVAAVAAFLWAYFGGVVPQSVLAKTALYGMPGPWAGRLWWEWLLPFPLGRFPAASEGIALMPLALILLASWIYGLRELWSQRNHVALQVAAAGLVILFGYSAVGVAYFWWYLVVPLACIAFSAAVGFAKVTRGRLVPSLALASVLGSWTVELPLYMGRAQAEYTNNASVAAVLKQRAAPGDMVLLEPIGMIGFETDLPVFDEAGLVTPEIVRRRLAGAGWYADMVAAHRPQWLVVRNAVLESGAAFAGAGAPFRTAMERDAVLSHYEQVWPSRAIEGIVLRVYRLRG